MTRVKNWVELIYSTTWYVVEVKYGKGGDIAIATCRTEGYDKPPKEKDNSYGFTQNFINEKDAKRYAVHVAKELNIPTCIKAD